MGNKAKIRNQTVHDDDELDQFLSGPTITEQMAASMAVRKTLIALLAVTGLGFFFMAMFIRGFDPAENEIRLGSKSATNKVQPAELELRLTTALCCQRGGSAPCAVQMQPACEEAHGGTPGI